MRKPRNQETQKFNWSKSYLILLFAGIFIFNSCEKDAVTDKQQIEIAQPTFKVKTLSKNDISTRSHVQQALNKVKKQLNPDLNTKIVYDSINNIWINDNNVNYVTSGNYESYTFGVYDPNAPDELKNLILHKQSDSTFTPILTKYIKSSIDNSIIDVEYSLLNSMSFQFSQKNTHIGERLQPCHMQSDCKCWMIVGFDDDGNALISIKDDCAEGDNSSSSGGGYDDGDSSGDDDSSDDSNTGTGAGSNPPGDGTPNGDGEGSGGSSGTSTNDGNNLPIVTKPVKLTREEILTNQLNDLIEGTNESFSLGNESNLSLNFNTFEDFEIFRNDFLANFPTNLDSHTNDLQPNGKIRVTSISNLGPSMRISVGCDVTLDDPNTSRIDESSVENVNSYLSGADIFYEYVHNNSLDTYDSTTYTDFNVLYVRGDLKVHLTIGSFLRIWTLDTRTTVMIRKSDASVISAYTEIQF
ncbi:hypothetical protein [Nonlabens sp.]|uniref:hypothetical protein n=1 Tax=Nonlabens sp. TaxID=1888209 RepID=UPI003F69A2B1